MMMTMAQLGDLLEVDRRQVWAWYTRRDRNGFPNYVKTRPLGVNGRTRRLWDSASVVRWHRSYVPSVGGRPKLLKRSA